MGLGFSFGSSDSNVSTNTNFQQQQNQLQQKGTTQNQTGSSSTSQSATGTSQTSGTSASKNAGATSSSTKGSQTQTQTGQSFSDLILQALEGSTTQALAAANGSQVNTNINFDPTSFVNSGVAAAAADQQAQLEQSINSLFDTTGGTAGGNSMTALLANRLRGDAAASLAGTRADLTAKANEIQQGNIRTALAGQAQQQGFAAQLLDALKGGVTTQTGQASTTQAQTGSSESTGQSNTGQTSQQQQQQQSDTTQTLMSVINELLRAKGTTTGSSQTNQNSSKSGSGFGLSI